MIYRHCAPECRPLFGTFSMADSLKVVSGDIIYTKVDMYQNLIALIDKFNDEVADP